MIIFTGFAPTQAGINVMADKNKTVTANTVKSRINFRIKTSLLCKIRLYDTNMYHTFTKVILRYIFVFVKIYIYKFV